LGNYRKITEGQNAFMSFHGASATASVKKYLVNVSCFNHKTYWIFSAAEWS